MKFNKEKFIILQKFIKNYGEISIIIKNISFTTI